MFLLVHLYFSSVLSVVTEPGSPAISYDYQWQYDNGTSWNNVAPGTPSGASYINDLTASMTVQGITVTGDFDYRVLVTPTSPSCTQIESSSVTLYVVGQPDVTDPPDPGLVCNGKTHTMTIVATGGTPTLLYQWEQSADGSTGWANVTGGSGATDPSYTTPPLYANTYYRVLVDAAGSNCNLYNSDVVLVTVNTLTPGEIAADETICFETSPALFNSTTDATPINPTGTITYQWEKSTTSASAGFATIPSATSNTYSSGDLTETTWFRRFAYSELTVGPLGPITCDSSSNVVQITVKPSPTVVAIDDYVYCNGRCNFPD